MAQRDGVPPCVIMDGAREQTMGEFQRKARQAEVHVKQTEPGTPWSNAAETGIREVKRGAGRKMTLARSPAALWDHCLELEGMIRSHTALDMYELEGQVPETIVSGQTADISPFVEFAWYDWVLYWDHTAKFPEEKEVLGRWLGPAIDVGPAMTAKILTNKGEVLYRSTYRRMTEEEVINPERVKEMGDFDQSIRTKLGDPVEHEELMSIDKDASTPEYELYDDDVEGTHEHVPDTDTVTPEAMDNYVGAQVSLPHHGSMRHGTVTR